MVPLRGEREVGALQRDFVSLEEAFDLAEGSIVGLLYGGLLL